jgi:hypothetical protein
MVFPLSLPRRAGRIAGLLIALSMSIALTSTAADRDDADATPVLTGTVTKAIDADTIDVRLAGGTNRVRLHVVDAPGRAQPWGREASAFLSQKILNQSVDIEPRSQDRYERVTAVVYAGDCESAPKTDQDIGLTSAESGSGLRRSHWMRIQQLPLPAMSTIARGALVSPRRRLTLIGPMPRPDARRHAVAS